MKRFSIALGATKRDQAIDLMDSPRLDVQIGSARAPPPPPMSPRIEAAALASPRVAAAAAAAGAGGLPSDIDETLRALAPGPTLVYDIETLLCAADHAHPGGLDDESPEELRIAAARRRQTLALAEAAAVAAAAGECELALRGYAAAFRQSGGGALLLGAANMLLKLGHHDAAEAAYTFLHGQPSLTANQKSLLVSKAEELKARRAKEAAQPEAGPPQTPATGARADRRASAKHMALDAEVLNSLSLQLKEEGNEVAF